MLNRLFYVVLGGATVLLAKSVLGASKPVTKTVYKGIARVNRGFERMAAEVREDLDDARQELAREEATRNPV